MRIGGGVLPDVSQNSSNQQPPCTPLHEHFGGYFMIFIGFFIGFSLLSEHCRRKLLRISGIA
jgi:hypothetical protein